MNRIRRLSTHTALTLFLLAVATVSASADQKTERLLDELGVRRGIVVVVLGDASPEAAIQLAEQSELLVYVQLPDADHVAQARRMAQAAGLDATRVQIDQGMPSRLHLADNVADAAVVLGDLGSLPARELMRVVRPRGCALIGGRRLVKRVPEGVDDWTHPYHGPDNNPVSTDTHIRAPYMTQFLADPRYGPAPQVAVAAGGRLFKAYGHVAWHEREEPLLNTLVAYNGFNGTELWRRALPEGVMVHRNTIVATDDVLYMADDKSCKQIDAATGKTLGEIAPPVDIAGGTFWKWMAMIDGVLYGLLGEPEQADETMRWKRDAHGWPWNGISKGYEQPEQPWGYGRNLLAMNPETKEVLWRHHEDDPIDARAVCSSGGRVFAFRFGEYLTCLDAKSGKVLWRKTPANDAELFDSLGEYSRRQGYSTNWRTTAYLKCSDQALYFAGPQVNKLLAVAADDGRILWEHPYDNFQIVVHPKGLYAISGPWGNNLSKKFDPMTGEILAELPTGRRACTRPTGTPDSLLYRAMGGSIRFDLADEQPRWLSPMRPPCFDGVTVANGLLYWWPYACDCQLSLNGFTSTSSAGDFDFSPDVDDPARIERGDDVSATTVEPISVTPKDWPTFRANNRRTAVSQATIPEETRVVWSVGPPAKVDARPTPPVAVDGLVFLADSDGAVRALDAQSGQARWQAHTGGEIRIAPTVWKGRTLVSSGDGWVYAFDAADGRLAWRFRAAPAERKIPVYGKLLSSWPAASGVLVEDDTAYVAAGLVNYDGTYVYALDPNNGDVQWCNDTSGHLDPEARTGVSVQGHMLFNGGRLYLAGGNAVSPAVYDAADGRCLNNADPLALCESTSPRGWELFLIGEKVIGCGSPFYMDPNITVYDHTVTKKILHASTAEVDVVWLNSATLLGYRPLAVDALSACVTDERIPRHITQAWGQFTIEDRPLWRFDRADAVAVAVAQNAVVLADATEVIALDLTTGKPLWRHALDAPPVPWGLAIDRTGRVIVTLVNGRVVCVGE